jgi:hypothetical protein
MTQFHLDFGRVSFMAVIASACFYGAPLLAGPMGEWCHVWQEYDVQTSIACVGGACSGEMVVFCEQSSCLSKEGGGDCKDHSGILYIIYPFKPVYLGLFQWIDCTEGADACLLCMTLVTERGGRFAAVLCEAVCLQNGMDYCCYTECVSDPKRKTEVDPNCWTVGGLV